MKVTASKSIEFPKLQWSIAAGETKELPVDKEVAARILAHPAIRKEKAKLEPKQPSI
jgi:hypothetical protein